MKRKKRSRFAQNRIDYIVFGNPKGAAQLVYDYGYEPAENLHDLSRAVRQLIRKKGRKAVRKLISIHPDRKAILKVESGKEDNYCGMCSSYSYNPQDKYCGGCGHSHYDGKGDKKDFLRSLVDMGTDQLKTYYESIVRKSNNTPEDPALSEQVQMVWNELRQRKQKQDREEDPEDEKIKAMRRAKEGFIIISLVFAAGILVGSALTKKPSI